MNEIYLTRQTHLSTLIGKSNLAGICLNPGPTLTYLTGLSFHLMERPTVLIMTPGHPPVIVLPELEILKVTNLTYEIKAFPYSEDPTTWVNIFRDAANYLNVEKLLLGVEPTRLRFLELQLLEKAFEKNQFTSAESILADLRMRKGSDEIKAMRKAVQIAQESLVKTLPSIRLGMTEHELAAELTLQLLKQGSDSEFPFSPLVQFGPNSANPHGGASNRTLNSGDLVLIDWGAAHQGYISDLTRTFIAGEPTPELIRIAQIVVEANIAGRATVRPGAQAGDIDQATRSVIDSAGYGKYFTHRTGHGIGLEGHEEPYIRAGNSLVLEPGMTFTIEPGIYLPGIGGVRIEDNVVVTAKGSESLSDLPRNLLHVG